MRESNEFLVHDMSRLSNAGSLALNYDFTRNKLINEMANCIILIVLAQFCS